MARFQSRLFNWIDCSLPAQLGRKARDWYEQFGNPVKQAAESIKKTTTKALLYPVFILASATNFRAKSHRVPLLLRPVQSLVLWIDRSKIFAIEKSDRPNQKSAHKSVNIKSKSPKKSRSSNQNITKLEQLFLGNRLGSSLGDRNQSLSFNNSGEDLNRMQKLIKDAIAYFFGKKSRKTKLKSTAKKSLKPPKNTQPWLTMADVFDDDATVWPPLIINTNSELTNLNNRSLENLPLNNSLDPLNSSHNITTSPSPELTSSQPHETSRPLHAWIETQATFLGYVYDPFMQLIDWLDRLIANVERWAIGFWQKLIAVLCRFCKLF